MRRIVGFILLTAAFLGGYHLGRQKGSPDLIGYARQAAVAVAAVAGDVYRSTRDSDAAPGDEDGAPADAQAYDRAGVDPAHDTRVYVYQRRASSAERRAARAATAAEPAADGPEAVAHAPSDGRSDWAGQLWRAIKPPKNDDAGK